MRLEMSGAVARLSANSLRLTLSETLSIAATGPKRYRIYKIKKRNGEERTICHPSRELKALQYVLIRTMLSKLPVHEAATAYVVGGSIKDNAARHVGGRVVYKLDFQKFFPSIQAGDWNYYVRAHLPGLSSEDIRFTQNVFFWGEGTAQPKSLSIGAPSSPFISNALMFGFDRAVTDACQEIDITYSRYADDLTFSSRGHIDKLAVRTIIRSAIRVGGIPRLTLNEDKTVLASNGTRRRITGLILTNDGSVSLGRERKRTISSLVDHARKGDLPPNQFSTLRGWLAFASDVEPAFIDRLRMKYSKELIDRIIKHEPLEGGGGTRE